MLWRTTMDSPFHTTSLHAFSNRSKIIWPLTEALKEKIRSRRSEEAIPWTNSSILSRVLMFPYLWVEMSDTFLGQLDGSFLSFFESFLGMGDFGCCWFWRLGRLLRTLSLSNGRQGYHPNLVGVLQNHNPSARIRTIYLSLYDLSILQC